MVKHDVKDINLAKKENSESNGLPGKCLFSKVSQNALKKKPLKGLKLAACLHVTTETANLMETLRDGGAQAYLCASNPLSTQDDVAASLVKNSGIPVFAIKGEDHKTYYKHIMDCLSLKPNITMDDGADLVSVLHTKKKTS